MNSHLCQYFALHASPITISLAGQRRCENRPLSFWKALRFRSRPLERREPAGGMALAATLCRTRAGWPSSAIRRASPARRRYRQRLSRKYWLPCFDPPGNATHWTGLAVAKAASGCTRCSASGRRIACLPSRSPTIYSTQAIGGVLSDNLCRCCIRSIMPADGFSPATSKMRSHLWIQSHRRRASAMFRWLIWKSRCG